ncbi:MAG: HIRAN domain-containing protein [Methanobrevibacter sp.]|jgi:hypothetical protein|nr:HIRAN domain-containing protein [Candidatus Methanovirga meridionalis]
MEKNYVTITGVDYYENLSSFELGEIIRLKKEPNNSYDHEAIKAEIPFTGKIGYVANSSAGVVKGTMSAGRIYDKVEEITYVKIIFITIKELICEFIDYKESENEIEAIESLFEKWDEEKLSDDYEDSIVDDKFLMNEEEREFDGNIKEHLFKVDLDNMDHDDIPSEIKDELANLILNAIQTKGIGPLRNEIFEEGGTKLKFVSKPKKSLAMMKNSSVNKIDHDEIAIFTYKKEELINKYFEIKKKILDIDDSINYKISNKDAHFYYDDAFFASITIKDDFISVAIRTNDKIETNENVIETKRKNMYVYEFIIKEKDKIEGLINFIYEFLL